ncbi:hypothetical protein RFI_02744 [Reticulomyxa filosa]|uniref:Uncharacterized protein n=1 Tax=Reticulomyxa filosa TaxID=46433 RepID=X6P8A5_RETFI|nr:hypothetical protein RFI_02744 [Reticulomyxa filosa]|eukprot:ETO34348.1 hypothetical protein RFI_02744 [Reticulomyxa filosa]
MSVKAIVYSKAKKKSYEMTLSTLILESLSATAKKLWFSKKSDSEDDLQQKFEIRNKENVRIEKDKDIDHVQKRNQYISMYE